MEHSPLISIGLPVSLFLIMVGMGLTLTLRDFRQAALAPWPITFGVTAQLAVLPILAFFIAKGLGLDANMTIGLVLIAACPGGTTSNLFAFLGKGDVALSILLTVIASLIAIVTLPFFVNWAMADLLQKSINIQLPILETMATLFAIVLVPVAFGMFIRKKAPRFAMRSEKGMNVFGFVVLAGVIAALIVNAGDGIAGMVRDAGLAVVLLNTTGILLGLVVGRLAGLNKSQAFTVAVELGIKNGALGLMVALSLLGSKEMSIAAAVYSVVMFIFGVAMIGFGRLTNR
ncbi:MAG: bile acid:sodium symporter family protein [Venatoribacter sp.]